MAALWVKVDVKGNKSQSILMSWGNASATDASDSHAVFDTKDGFVGVWHLAEKGSTTAGGYKDATANGANTTGVGKAAPGTIAGRVGQAVSLDHSKTQWIRLDGDKNKLFDIYNKLTYSIWIYAKSHTVEYQAAFTKGETGFRMHYYGLADWTENKNRNIVEICVNGGSSICPLKGGNDAAWKGTDVAPGKWFHWVAVHNYPKLTFYLNAVLEASSDEAGTWKSGPEVLAIGNNVHYASARSWDGYLDEARVMNIPKDANWVKLEYESQREGQSS